MDSRPSPSVFLPGPPDPFAHPPGSSSVGPCHPLGFVLDCSLLPYDYNELHAHIIDAHNMAKSTNTEEATAIDAAVTCLYNNDLEDVEVLSEFISPQLNSFNLISTVLKNTWKFMVLREDNRVVVSKVAPVCQNLKRTAGIDGISEWKAGSCLG